MALKQSYARNAAVAQSEESTQCRLLATVVAVVVEVAFVDGGITIGVRGEAAAAAMGLMRGRQRRRVMVMVMVMVVMGVG